MYERGESDSPVVPAKSPNNAASAVAEAVEEKGAGQGEHGQQSAPRTQSRSRRVKCAGSCASSGTTG